ncbi:MAG: hypothetical protein QNK04_09875 [Myxococcota bacterium]|nr:hypothetical protein [Myxococcota bacterium]
MKFLIPAIALFVVGFAAAQAQAQSCSTFAQIQAYDAEEKTATLKYTKGSQSRYFPKPEGSPSDSTKIPKKCTKRVTRNTTAKVKPAGGRMTVTQLRMNFSGKMLNNLDDAGWVPGQLEKLISDKTKVVVVLRPGKGKKDPPELTTIYLPITDDEKAEIARIDAQAQDVE